MREKISIVVPVYNVKQYLKECINSLITQTYQNIEIILVDDGSTDGSTELCDMIANSNDKIRVVHKKNAGLGMARNTGIDNATGKYIMFIDSDDYLDENAVNEMYNKLVTNKIDAVFCGMKRFSENTPAVDVPRKFYNDVFRGESLVNRFLFEMTGTKPHEPIDSYLYMSVCTGLYSLSIIKENSLRFFSERELISEDYIFNLDYFSLVNSVGFIPGNYYYYRNNINSLTHTYNPERFKRNIIMYEFILNNYKSLCSNEEFKNRLDRMFLGRVRAAIVQSIKSDRPLNEIKGICNNTYVCDILKHYPYYRNPLRQRIFNHCLKHKLTIPLYFIGNMYNKLGK